MQQKLAQIALEEKTKGIMDLGPSRRKIKLRTFVKNNATVPKKTNRNLDTTTKSKESVKTQESTETEIR